MAKKKLYEIDPDSEVKATGNGYVFVTTSPDHPGAKMKDHKKTYVYKHVVLLENSLGRGLRKNEVVHHIDEDPSNNTLSNLELSTDTGHPRDHSKKNHFWKKSPLNKPKSKKPKSKRKAAQTVAARFIQGFSG